MSKFILEITARESTNPKVKEDILHIEIGYEDKKSTSKNYFKIHNVNKDSLIVKTLKEIENLPNDEEKMYNLFAMCYISKTISLTLDDIVNRINNEEVSNEQDN